MIEQPKWDDDVLAWRRYAGQLRQEIGRLKARMDGVRKVEIRAKESAERLAGARGRADRWKENFESLRRAKNRDGSHLDELERLLADGDVPAAVDLLAERRRNIEAANEKGPRR